MVKKRKKQGTPEPEERVATLEHAAAALEDQEKQLDAQVLSALEAGENPKSLQAKRREVHDSLDDIKRTLPGLRERVKENRLALCQAQAADRMLGTRRAYGSLLRQYEADEVRVLDAAKEYHSAVGLLNGRYKSLGLLAAEAGALGSRFGIPLSKLASPVVPALRTACGEAVRLVTEVKYVDHGHISPDIETCEHGLRKRRSYLEVQGTEAFEIIKAAGLPAWPPLTDMQKSIVAGREQDAQEERDFAKRIGGEIAVRRSLPAV